jgi:hypothetical protein
MGLAMKTCKYLVAQLFCFGLSLGFLNHAHAQADTASNADNQVTASITRHYHAGSVEVVVMQQWLLTNGGKSGDVVKSNSLGDTTVKYTITRSTADAVTNAMNENNPPASFPSRGNPGDQISISSTADGKFSSWTYEWAAPNDGQLESCLVHSQTGWQRPILEPGQRFPLRRLN